MAEVTNCMIRIQSVQEYLGAVDQAFRTICGPNQGSNCELWYRGLAKKTFTLLPSIARGSLNPLFEIVYLSKFKSLVIPQVQSLPSFPLPNGIPSYWHWLFMMQHYGVPTRLLDWSRDALTALFFATDRTNPDVVVGTDAAVFVLNPVKLNEVFTFNPNLKPGYIPNVEEPEFNALFGPQNEAPTTLKPAAAIGPLNSPHIVAQRGVFTVFPHVKNLTALENFSDASNYLFKICIAWESFDIIRTQLARYGITRFTLFPDITEIVREINQQVQDEGIIS